MTLFLMKYILIAVFLMACSIQAYAQIDSINYQIEAAGAAATEGYLPLWIVSNRFGVLDEDGADGYLRVGASIPFKKDKKFTYAAGLDLLAKPDFSESRVQQGYLKLRYWAFELRGGWVEESINVYHKSLSTGALYLSQNSRPIPMITIGIPEYTDVPFTKGYFEIKGRYGHGWLGDDRFVENPYLHEKFVYGRVGGDWPVRLFGGLLHSAMWGGTHPTEGKLNSSFEDYLKIITGSSGGGSSPGGEQVNALGDHRGTIDYGAEFSIKEYDFILYSQVPFEDNSGFETTNPDRLVGLSMKSRDNTKWVTGVVYEFLHTKFQSGPGLTDPFPWDTEDNYGYDYAGRDNYYGNYLYNTGWAHHGYILGTPLFLTDQRADLYFDGYTEPSRDAFKFYVVNNRVVAHHVGIEGQITPKINYRFLATYSRNYGTYTGLNGGIQQWGSMDPDYNVDYEFDPPLDQWYLMLEAKSKLGNHLSLTTTLGLDAGEMTDNFGAFVGLTWDGAINVNSK